MRKLLLLVFVVSTMQACCLVSKNVNDSNPTDKEMNFLEITVFRLSKAVEGLLWSGASADDALIEMACAHDGSLCQPLNKHQLKLRVVGENAVLLLCSADGKRALVEDIACTATPDFRAWAEGNMPCDFTLSDERVGEACR